ncbi:MAG TPA: small ribosomal subunit Rsm22 family protein [Devosia sp.]|uniref:small ribosomal subunit Rsm22 family protein n=1 Tax=Devosia sp. TaxID=1871048 RepID=UPI002DDCB830|nr:small ribosomal subunit Rsm22 family protein [Devosia sp.]HEV2514006.1 small ribosomal subunit Rsm22 family protein [Devosia sp.]
MTDLPADLSAAVRRLAEGRKGLGDSSARISEHYRQRGASRQVIGGADDAVAYALSRMPATYAAVSAVLEELQARAPEFAPRTLLDAGAGPGTAGWAVAEAFEGIAPTLMDHNRAFLALAATLAEGTALAGAELLELDLGRFELATRYDLVTCAYALTELPDAEMLAAAARLWRHSDGVLAIIEPGRPRDYQRLMAVRRRLIELGGRVLAPCPHERDCPLLEPDWCHFSVRLSRSRDHMRLKGGTLGYEDEKYSYLVMARPGIGAPAAGRVLRRPEENKFSVTLAICGADGLETRVVPSRDKLAFKAAKKLDWGDATTG